MGANGLTFTPLAQNVKDIHEWFNSDAVPEERRTKLISGADSLMNNEKVILADWKTRK